MIPTLGSTYSASNLKCSSLLLEAIYYRLTLEALDLTLTLCKSTWPKEGRR